MREKAETEHRDTTLDLHPHCTNSTLLQVFDEDGNHVMKWMIYQNMMAVV